MVIIMEKKQETRVAMIGILVQNRNEVEQLNKLLHDYREYIIGRMGVPYKEKDISIISIAMDAPQDMISALSGKIGMIKGISSKVIYAPEQ